MLPRSSRRKGNIYREQRGNWEKREKNMSELWESTKARPQYVESPVVTVRTTCFNIVFLFSWGGVRLSPFGTSAKFGLLYRPWTLDVDECGAVSEIRIGRGNRNTRRKPFPETICPPQISHDLTWVRTRAAAVGSRLLTSSAMARPALILQNVCILSTGRICVLHILTINSCVLSGLLLLVVLSLTCNFKKIRSFKC
jgi:hypothetical protein